MMGIITSICTVVTTILGVVTFIQAQKRQKNKATK